MTWIKPGRKCPHYSATQKGCRLVGAMCAFTPAPVTEDECARCRTLPEPTMDSPNEVTAVVKVRWMAEKRKRQPVQARLPEPSARARTSPAYTEADFPCPHRGEKTGEHQCTACDGGKLHILYDCQKHGKECTVLAAPKARGKDGEHTLCCIACPDLPSVQERAGNLEASVGLVVVQGGQPLKGDGSGSTGSDPTPVAGHDSLPVALVQAV